MGDTVRVMDDQETLRKILNRLKRAQGQLAAVITAVENGGDCRETVTQLSAVTGALNRAGFAIISTAMRECLASDTNEGSREDDPRAKEALTIDQLEKLFMSLS